MSDLIDSFDGEDEESSVLHRRAVERVLVAGGLPSRDVPWLTDVLLKLKPGARRFRVPSQMAIEETAQFAVRNFGANGADRSVGLVSVLLWATVWIADMAAPRQPETEPDEEESHRPDPIGALLDPPDEEEAHGPDPISALLHPPSGRDKVLLRREPDLELWSQRLLALLPEWLRPEHEIDFDVAIDALMGGAEPGVGFLVRVGQLARQGRVDPLRHVDGYLLRKQALMSISSGLHLTPKTLGFWLLHAEEEVLACVHRLIEREPSETLGDLANGLLTLLQEWIQEVEATGPAPETRQRWNSAIRRSFDALSGRVTQGVGGLSTRAAHWWYGLAINAFEPLSDQVRKAFQEGARETLGIMRKRLEESADDKARDAIALDLPHYGRAVHILATFGGLWPAAKVLLLGLRCLPHPAVASDLRYWTEFGPDHEQPPATWSWIPQALSQVIHGFARSEQEQDPQLLEVRTKFAEFCLERLKTKDDRGLRERKGSVTNEDLLEVSPVWRRCYARAIRELRVNPRGRGHMILDWLAKNDPDASVRRDASGSATELRHGPKLPDGWSPRRPIFAALWQLRQAQFLAPGGKERPGAHLNEVGAKRTREKEVQRTREVEAAELGH